MMTSSTLVCMRRHDLRDLFPGTGRTYATHGVFFQDGQAGRPGTRAISGFVPGNPITSIRDPWIGENSKKTKKHHSEIPGPPKQEKILRIHAGFTSIPGSLKNMRSRKKIPEIVSAHTH